MPRATPAILSTPTPSPRLDIDIVYDGDGWPENAAAAAIRAAQAAWIATPEGAGYGRSAEVALILADDATIQALNRTWRGQDHPTNVLSFPVETAAVPADAPRLLGDVALARETLVREAASQGKSMTAHLTHLTVHGFLHLLGYDHMQETEARVMEALETRILAGLDVADPYVADVNG